MRSELVYQLKRALVQAADFRIDDLPEYLLVDEFQDLNACDLAVVEWLEVSGAQLFAAGNDDQSIYGFRNAYPLGIRSFLDSRPGSADLRLEICQRCDREILRLGDFVIRLDRNRVPKEIKPADGAERGDVRLARFSNQNDEARAIAQKCRELLTIGVAPNDILILLRQDRNKAFSTVIVEALAAIDDAPPVHVAVGEDTPLDATGGRQLLALLRLASDSQDSIAWRTLLELDRNNLGDAARQLIRDEALRREVPFSSVLVEDNDDDTFGNRTQQIREYVASVMQDLGAIRLHLDTSSEEPESKHEALLEKLSSLSKPERILSQAEFAAGIDELLASLSPSAIDLNSAMAERGTAIDDEEVVRPGAINILTMHKAKGLGADTVFVVCAEDEYIPGRASEPAAVDDERRLFYVSLTRARHRLYITYCENRRGAQTHSGSTSGTPGRTLTRFLRDGPLQPARLGGES